MQPLEERIKSQARALGFELVGVAPATAADGLDRLHDWLQRGFAGEMNYMQRQAEARSHPSAILPEVRSVIMAGMNYKAAGETSELAPQHGKVARYARGTDYHDLLRERLNRLLEWLRTEIPNCRGRGVVDTAPLLERDFARRAGLGWFGKNTMLLNRRLGSYFLIGALLVDTELRADPPHQSSHCGTCTACLDACPTEAFVGPGMLDSRRCLSYLTIELRGSVAEDLRPHMKEWLFGCDVCQEVCPWNSKAPAGAEPALGARADLEAVDLRELFEMSEEALRTRFKGTALWRSRRRGLLRNAALILGNQGNVSAIPILERAAADSDDVVRAAAQWALKRLQQQTASLRGQ
jgi:epoxyqueuosine reductase